MPDETVIVNGETGPTAPAPTVTDRPDDVPEKFWDAEKGEVNTAELLKAHGALETKLGADDEPAAETEEGEAAGDSESAMFPASKTEDMKAYEVEAYGAEVAAVFDKAGMDAKAVADEYTKTGELPEDAYTRLGEAGYPKGMVDAYLTGLSSTAEDQGAIAKADRGVIQDSIGGSDEYAKMVAWASNNMEATEVDAFNKAVDGDKAVAALAVKGLHARFTDAMGSEPDLVGGKAGDDSGDKFASTAELTSAMKDPRYKTDEAYRGTVAAKLSRSSIFRHG